MRQESAETFLGKMCVCVLWSVRFQMDRLTIWWIWKKYLQQVFIDGQIQSRTIVRYEECFSSKRVFCLLVCLSVRPSACLSIILSSARVFLKIKQILTKERQNINIDQFQQVAIVIITFATATTTTAVNTFTSSPTRRSTGDGHYCQS